MGGGGEGEGGDFAGENSQMRDFGPSTSSNTAAKKRERERVQFGKSLEKQQQKRSKRFLEKEMKIFEIQLNKIKA